MILGAGGGLWYVQHLKAENEILKLNNEKLEGAVENQKAVIEQQLADIKQQKEINQNLSKVNEGLNKDLNNLDEKYNKINASGQRRDVGDLALNKPKSVELILNKYNKENNRCIEIAQGSALTEAEKNATKKSQANSVCPELANPNYVDY
jgi:hypothetical protein